MVPRRVTFSSNSPASALAIDKLARRPSPSLRTQPGLSICYICYTNRSNPYDTYRLLYKKATTAAVLYRADNMMLEQRENHNNPSINKPSIKLDTLGSVRDIHFNRDRPESCCMMTESCSYGSVPTIYTSPISIASMSASGRLPMLLMLAGLVDNDSSVAWRGRGIKRNLNAIYFVGRNYRPV